MNPDFSIGVPLVGHGQSFRASPVQEGPSLSAALPLCRGAAEVLLLTLSVQKSVTIRINQVSGMAYDFLVIPLRIERLWGVLQFSLKCINRLLYPATFLATSHADLPLCLDLVVQIPE